MQPALHWREIEVAIQAIWPEIEGLFVERFYVPERSRFPAGYLKNEYALRLSSRGRERTLIFSVHPRRVYFYIVEGKGPKPSTRATLSPFGQALSKTLTGRKILGASALPQERIAWLEFSDADPRLKMALVWAMIPALPEALWADLSGTPWKAHLRSRDQKSAETGVFSEFAPPQGAAPPKSPLPRAGWEDSPFAPSLLIQAYLDQEAWSTRARALSQEIKKHLEHFQSSEKKSRQALWDAGSEPEWEKFANLLKSHLDLAPKPGSAGVYRLTDWETQETIEVPADPKLSPVEQVQRFFLLAKRKARRAGEAASRAQEASRRIAELARLENAIPATRNPGEKDWALIEEIEKKVFPQKKVALDPSRAKRIRGFSGRQFVSCDGFPILVGRKQDENIELSLKVARGNDVWLHLKGRPSTHVVILLPQKKTASLETLLDAATLLLFFSGGKDWGKTDVDYTLCKNLKRIKGSPELRYTQNRTLSVSFDPKRFEKLTSD